MSANIYHQDVCELRHCFIACYMLLPVLSLGQKVDCFYFHFDLFGRSYFFGSSQFLWIRALFRVHFYANIDLHFVLVQVIIGL